MADGMFSFDPNALMQQRAQQMQEGAAAYAKQTPQQQADTAGYGFGGALAGGVRSLLGIPDKGLMQVQQANEIMRDVDRNDPEALLAAAKKLGQAGNMQAGEAVYKAAQELKAAQSKASLEAAKTLREEAQATEIPRMRHEEALLRIQATQEAAAQRAEAARMRSEDTRLGIEQRREAAAAAADARREATAARVQMAQLVASVKGDKPAKPLPPKLQADEIEDLKLIDASEQQKKILTPVITALTPDPVTKKAPLELGPMNNLDYMARNAAGNSTPASRAFAQLKEAVDTAVNIKVSAEKGVQTDKDVLRFANAMIAAFGRNDTTATREAITRFNSAVDDVSKSTRKIIDSRRKSQNVEPYFGEAAKEVKGNIRKTASGIEYTVEP